MKKVLVWGIYLLLSKKGALAQGTFTVVKSADNYRKATIIVLGEQGSRTQRVFTTTQHTLAEDSATYRQYDTYITHLQREGYRLQATATGADFMEYTYSKEK